MRHRPLPAGIARGIGVGVGQAPQPPLLKKRRPFRLFEPVRQPVRQLGIGVLAGTISGFAAAAFLAALKRVTTTRLEHDSLLWFLPIAGLVIGLAYAYLGGRSAKGNNLLIEELHEPTAWIPRRMAPMIFVGTLVSHLFGASVGREGTGIQMAGSLCDLAARVLRFGPDDRRTMLVAAIAGGFASVFGVPLAGCVFALEVQAVGRVRYDGLIAALAASVTGDLVVRAVGVHHDPLPALAAVHLDTGIVVKVAAAGVAFGLASLAFTWLVHRVKASAERHVRWAPGRAVVGGIVLIGMTLAVGTRDYLGLSTPLAARALAGGVGLVAFAFALKILFTAVALGTGFVGGEVTPLFVTGATLGALLGRLLHAPVPLLAAIGFVAVFGAAANTPLACAVMGIELFGSSGAALFAVGCVVAYACSPHRGIYHAQRTAVPKRPRRVGGEGGASLDP